MPVHPTLARILAEWKLSGFERLTGRKPRPEVALALRRSGAAPKALRRALHRIEELLDE